MCSHVYYMSGDAWKEGGIDATGQHILIYYCQLTLISFLLMLIFSCIVLKEPNSFKHVLSFQLHSQDMLLHVFGEVNILTPSSCFIPFMVF